MTEDTARAEELGELCSRLGLHFRDLTLLERALTHASILSESPQPVRDYESLEFIGDAVLGLAVAHYLYENVPDRTPGEYSRMRAGLVNRRCLAHVARELNIAPVIRLGKGEELSGGRRRSALLADCLEALIGALYLDRGWDAARGFIARAFAGELDRELSSGLVWDFKSRLQNYCQAKRMGLPEFRVIRSEGPDHQKEFEVEVAVESRPAGCGRGTTKKAAEQQAAREALQRRGQRFE